MNSSSNVTIVMDASVTFLKLFVMLIDLPIFFLHLMITWFIIKQRALHKQDYCQGFFTIFQYTVIFDGLLFLSVSV